MQKENQKTPITYSDKNKLNRKTPHLQDNNAIYHEHQTTPEKLIAKPFTENL